jgi:hypothetical protein
MAVDQQGAVRSQSPIDIDVPAPGEAVGAAEPTVGNERLTALAGSVLLIPLAVVGVTLIQLRPLLSVHFFVGTMLIGPVALKLATTGYRFVRYYTGDLVYRRKGPPPAPLRVIAPFVVASTVVVLATGVALLFAGPASRDTLLPIHKISFFVWAGFTGLHLLGHLTALPRALRGDLGGSASLGEAMPGRNGRLMAVAGALVAGAVLAVLTIPEFGAWLHSSGAFGHHHG